MTDVPHIQPTSGDKSVDAQVESDLVAWATILFQLKKENYVEILEVN